MQEIVSGDKSIDDIREEKQVRGRSECRWKQR